MRWAGPHEPDHATPLGRSGPGWAAGLPLSHLAPGLALAFGLAACLSLALSRQPGSVATVWYANALAVAVLAHRPLGDWPALLAGVALATLGANALWGDQAWSALSFVPANLAEMAIAAVALRRSGVLRQGLDSATALGRALLVGGLLPPLAGASLAWLTVSLPTGDGLSSLWLPWAEGSIIGSLSALPLALLVAREGWQPLRALTRQLRWWALLCAALGVALVATSTLPYPFVYITLPLLAAAVLLRAEGTFALTLAVSVALAAALDQGVLVPPPQSAAWQQVFVYLALAAALLPGQLLASTVHELRSSRERLAQQSAALQRANEGLEQFVRIASHDLREPLNTITAFGGLLRDDAAQRLDDTDRRHLTMMLQGTARMRTLLDDVLQFVRVQQVEEPGRVVVDLDQLLAQAREALGQLLASSGARLEVGHLGRVHGHPALLQLVLQNLLTNAVKFVEPGQVPHIRIQAHDEGAICALQVLDNGIGIDPQAARHLFQPFQRLHPRRRFEGTGLGLALSRQIVQRLGGSIEVAPAEGGGSCFTVRLPRAPG